MRKIFWNKLIGGCKFECFNCDVEMTTAAAGRFNEIIIKYFVLKKKC